MADTTVIRTKVFVSYSHQDKEWLKRLRVHLRPLERRYGVDVWVDTDIKPGSQWRAEIERALATAKVAILLVSADFIASDFVEKNELPPLLRAAEAEGIIILPLILSPSMFSRMDELARFQTVNDPSMPLVNLTKGEQEAALVRLTEAVEKALGYVPNKNEDEHGVRKLFRPTSRQGATGEDRFSEGGEARPRRRMSPAIWVALISGLVISFAAYWLFVYGPRLAEVENYTGRVTDATTGKPIHNAKVTIEEGRSVPQIQRTDSEGVFHVMLRDSNGAARILIDADGYQPIDRNVSFSRTGVERISLTAAPTPTPTPVRSPSPIPRPTSTRPRPRPKCTAQDILLGKC